MNTQEDFCSEAGAKRLQEAIERYWAFRGKKVKVWVTNEGFTPALRSTRFDLRSNLVNGWPSFD
jgi:hypothetical protein